MGKVWKPRSRDLPSIPEIKGRILAGFADTPQEEFQAYQKAMGPENVRHENYVEALPPIRVKRGSAWVEPDAGIDALDFTTDQIPQIPSIVGAAAGFSAAGPQGAVGGAMIGEAARRKIGQKLGVGDGKVDKMNAILAGMGEALPIMATIGTSKIAKFGGAATVQDQIKKLAKKHGFSVNLSASNKSASKYLELSHPNIENKIKIRISDHELPEIYGQADYDVVSAHGDYAKKTMAEIEKIIKGQPISGDHVARKAAEKSSVIARADQIVPQIINSPNGLASAVMESRGSVYNGQNGRQYKRIVSKKFSEHYGEAFDNAMRDLDNATTVEERAQIMNRLRK